MVREPHRNFGDAGGEFAISMPKLIHVNDARDVGCRAPAGAVEEPEDFNFQQPQFAVGDDEKIAATAGGVEEAECAQAFVGSVWLRPCCLYAFKFRAEVVEEE